MRSITLGEKVLQYNLTYKKRKTLEIRVIPPGEVIVISPKGVSIRKIEEIIRQKESWLLNKLEQVSKINVSKKHFVNGELFYYLGKEYPIKLEINKSNNVVLIDDTINISANSLDEDTVKTLLLKWYYEQTSEIITELIIKNAKSIIIKPNNIKIKNQRKIWGSCSSKRNLNFNFRLSLMPVDVIEYIVVHELCHLIHMNHSKKFWTEVERILPDYKVAKKWVKDNGISIMNMF